ncbi:MAG: AAA family ATPase [Candidatus Hydrothermales bacterium]
MKVKSIILNGFKSFEKAEIVLSDKISLIVGPNGCGKSNIFEAVRFVLGENRLNKLRVKELKELIFWGTKEKRAAPFAEVSIWFQNESKITKFTRRVYRDNSQEFLIDDNNVSERSYKEEIEKFFGKKSYAQFQWEDVEELIRKPKERIKEMIFEACELYDFDHKKKVIEKRLEKTERDLKAFEIVLKDKEQRMRDLEEEMKRAQRYRILNEILKEKRNLVLKAEYSKLIRDKSKKEKELKESEEFFKNLESEVYVLKENIKKIIEEKEYFLKELENLRKEREPLLAQKERLLTELNRKYGELSTLKDREIFVGSLIEENKEKLVNLKKSLKDLELYSAFNRDEVEKVKKELEKIAKTVRENEKYLTRCKLRQEEIDIKIKSIQDRNRELLKNIEEIENNRKSREREIEELKLEIEKFKSLLSELESKSNYLSLEEKNKRENLFRLEREINKLEGELIKLKSILKIDEDTIPELEFLYSYLDFSKNVDYFIAIEDILDAKVLNNYELDAKIQEFLDKGGKVILEREKYEGSSISGFKSTEGIGNIIKERFSRLKIFDNKEKALVSWKKNECDYAVSRDGHLITRDGVLKKIVSNKIEYSKRVEELENIFSVMRQDLNSIKDEFAKVKRELDEVISNREKVRSKIQKLNLDYEKIKSNLNLMDLKLNSLKDEYEKNVRNLRDLEKEQEETNIEVTKREGELKELKNLEKRKLKEYELLRAAEEKYKEYESLKEKIKFYESSLLEREKELEEIKRKINDTERDIRDFEDKREALEKVLYDLGEKISRVESKLKEIDKELEEKKSSLNIKEKNLERMLERILKLRQDIHEIEKSLELYPVGIEFISENISVRKLKEEISEIEREIDRMHDVNLLAEKEFKVLESEYYEKIKAYRDLEESVAKLRNSLFLMEREAREKYLEFLNLLKEELKVISAILLGGDIKIEPHDEKNLLESELLIEVSPSGKKIRSILLLSGGERSLFALTFLFALAKLSPSPFFALDEIDASLDDSNTLRLTSYIEKLSEKSQLLIITHNKRTMEVKGRVYGITMDRGVSQVYGVQFD